jgi:hypothetical protein
MVNKQWEEFKIKIPSTRDGKIVEFTLDQIFNDYEFGHAVATDLDLPYERHQEALDYLRSKTKQFITEILSQREAEIRKETIEAVLPEDGIVRDELIYKAKEKFNITI